MSPTPEHAGERDATTTAEDAHPADDATLGHAERARRARLLATRLAALPIAVERAASAIAPVAVPSYPDGRRPSSTVRLEGGGHAGRGEHVGWTDAAHRDCAERLARLALDRCDTVGAVSALARGELADPYDRAALEAAAIDLALRQAASDPFHLTGLAPRPLRYVVSFERVADPVARARREIAPEPTLELKVDADPTWSEAILAELGTLSRVVVLDYKRTGDVAAHERAHRLLPETLLEDPLPGATPWSASLRRRVSLDATIGSAADVIAEPDPPAAINVKPARVGGVFEALAVVAAAAARGIDVYFGGMFEVGVGRAQLQTLATLLCPDGPNDVAPLATAERTAPRPLRLTIAPRDAGFAAW